MARRKESTAEGERRRGRERGRGEKSDCLNHPLSPSFFLFEGRKEGEDPSSPQSFLFFLPRSFHLFLLSPSSHESFSWLVVAGDFFPEEQEGVLEAKTRADT